MKNSFTVSTEIRTSEIEAFSSFGKIILKNDCIIISTGLKEVSLAKTSIFVLRHYASRFPNFTFIANNVEPLGYLYAHCSMFRRKKGNKIYNTLKNLGYHFTEENIKCNLFSLSKSLNEDIKNYNLKKPSS